MQRYKYAQRSKRISILIVLSILFGSFSSSSVVFADDIPTEIPPTETTTLEPTATATLLPTDEEVVNPASEEPEEEPTPEPTQEIGDEATEEISPTEEGESATGTLIPTEVTSIDSTPEVTGEETATGIPAETQTVTPTETPTEIPTATPEGELAPVIGLDHENLVPDRYIVVYKKGIDQDSAITSAREIIEKYGGKIRVVFDNSFHGFSAELPEQTLAEIRRDENIDYILVSHYIELDDEFKPDIDQEEKVSANAFSLNMPWGLDRIDQVDSVQYGDDRYYYPESAGEGVHVYVIDSGIYTDHEDFEGRIGNGYDFVDDDDDPNDTCNGHGTSVAGIIGGTKYGVAKKVTIHPIRAFECDGEQEDLSIIIEAIEWVIDNHIKPAVINISAGHLVEKEDADMNSLYEFAVLTAIVNDIPVIVSAGNDNKNACLYSPARISRAITVGGTNISDQRFIVKKTGKGSNYGSCLDLFAPGYNIASAAIAETDTGILPTYVFDLKGTSFAAPYVTGAAALYLSAEPDASSEEVRKYIIDSSTSNKVRDAKSGSPNILLRVSSSKPGKVQLTSLENGELINYNDPTLVWNISANASYYHVQVATSVKITNPEYDIKTGNTQYSLSSLADGKYYWRVSAYNPIGTKGDWSSTYSFTVDTTPPPVPVLKSPANGSTVTGIPTFSWNWFLPGQCAMSSLMEHPLIRKSLQRVQEN